MTWAQPLRFLVVGLVVCCAVCLADASAACGQAEAREKEIYCNGAWPSGKVYACEYQQD